MRPILLPRRRWNRGARASVYSVWCLHPQTAETQISSKSCLLRVALLNSDILRPTCYFCSKELEVEELEVELVEVLEASWQLSMSMQSWSSSSFQTIFSKCDPEFYCSLKTSLDLSLIICFMGGLFSVKFASWKISKGLLCWWMLWTLAGKSWALW